jgi:CheY-specific phosphatase CheX
LSKGDLLKVQYVNSILSAVKRVFVSALDMPVKFDNPYNKKRHHPSYDVSSIIKIRGELTGCIVLSYPKEMATILASEMLDEKLTEINEETVDAILEIANMVIGVADTELNLENVTYSLPSVIMTKEEIEYSSNTFVFSMPCSMDSGAFEVDIALSEINYA